MDNNESLQLICLIPEKILYNVDIKYIYCLINNQLETSQKQPIKNLTK